MFFQKLSNLFLCQHRYSLMPNYYQIPINILYLVATQIYLEVKEYFEEELITGYDNLFSLLFILSGGTTISNNSKQLLAKRLDKELLIEKKLLTNRKQNDVIIKLDKMLEQLGF